jgi:transposase-like protein
MQEKHKYLARFENIIVYSIRYKSMDEVCPSCYSSVDAIEKKI